METAEQQVYWCMIFATFAFTHHRTVKEAAIVYDAEHHTPTNPIAKLHRTQFIRRKSLEGIFINMVRAYWWPVTWVCEAVTAFV